VNLRDRPWPSYAAKFALWMETLTTSMLFSLPAPARLWQFQRQKVFQTLKLRVMKQAQPLTRGSRAYQTSEIRRRHESSGLGSAPSNLNHTGSLFPCKLHCPRHQKQKTALTCEIAALPSRGHRAAYVHTCARDSCGCWTGSGAHRVTQRFTFTAPLSDASVPHHGLHISVL
jgi:hypothetical protein